MNKKRKGGASGEREEDDGLPTCQLCGRPKPRPGSRSAPDVKQETHIPSAIADFAGGGKVKRKSLAPCGFGSWLGAFGVPSESYRLTDSNNNSLQSLLNFKRTRWTRSSNGSSIPTAVWRWKVRYP